MYFAFAGFLYYVSAMVMLVLMNYASGADIANIYLHSIALIFGFAIAVLTRVSGKYNDLD